MKRLMATVLAAVLITSALPAAARSDDDEALEKRLADAQRRLEDAAREVAELSAEAGRGGVFRDFVFAGPQGRRAMLGVNLGGAEPNGGGVRVAGVSPGGPAAEAGVREGDVIVSIRDKPVTTGREIVRVMEDIEPGDKVELGVSRGGKPVKLAVEARPLDRVFFAGVEPAMAAMRALPPIAPQAFEWEGHWLLEDWGDAEFVTLTPGLGRYFGAEKGVLVARAPADAALGLKDGDVIVAIDGREPQNNRHAMRILRSYQPGESVEIRILRDRRAQTLRASIPERKQRDLIRHRLPEPPDPPQPPAPPAAPGEPATT